MGPARKRCTFLKERTKKRLPIAPWLSRAPSGKVFSLLFLQKKKNTYFLPIKAKYSQTTVAAASAVISAVS
jgi:hypothetical protein